MADRADGINQFAMMLQGRMHDVSTAARTIKNTIDIGLIQGDLSIKLALFGKSIPKGEYRVCRTLTLGAVGVTLTQTKGGQGTHPHGSSGGHGGHTAGDGAHVHPNNEGAHTHDALVPTKMRSLLPGDEVLVVWAGTEVIVVDILEQS